MKSALIAAALSLLVTPALADTKIEACTTIADTAKSAMQLRQTGADMPSLVKALDRELDGGALDLGIGLLQLAYDEPLFSGAEYKERAANEFSSTVFRACLEVRE